MKLSSHKPRTHLVNLIVTFRLKNHYYLVFPWAEGNFWDFAQTYEFGPHPTSDIQQRVWARLLAIQIHDIASGIQAIHVIRLSTTTEIYGRHGDIKPKNILWFEEQANSTENPMENRRAQTQRSWTR